LDCGNGNGPPLPKIKPPLPAMPTLPALPTAPPAPAVCAPALPPPGAPPAWAPPAGAPPAGAPELPACAGAPALLAPAAPAAMSSDELLPASQAEITNAETATIARRGRDLCMLEIPMFPNLEPIPDIDRKPYRMRAFSVSPSASVPRPTRSLHRSVKFPRTARSCRCTQPIGHAAEHPLAKFCVLANAPRDTRRGGLSRAPQRSVLPVREQRSAAKTTPKPEIGGRR
jgi:hypothetical protein